MICALCGCELRGFADGVMVERLVPREERFPLGSKLSRTERVLVCRDDDDCGARRIEAEQKRNAGETKP
jgi:hypothetical protein